MKSKQTSPRPETSRPRGLSLQQDTLPKEISITPTSDHLPATPMTRRATDPASTTPDENTNTQRTDLLSASVTSMSSLSPSELLTMSFSPNSSPRMRRFTGPPAAGGYAITSEDEDEDIAGSDGEGKDGLDTQNPNFNTKNETGGLAHQFKNVTFTKPTWCGFCRNMVWGLAKQGQKCSTCGYVCHTRCRNMVEANEKCKPPDITTDEQPGDTGRKTHMWQQRHFSVPTFCNQCQKMLYGVGKQGSRCYFCGTVAHQGCKAELDSQGVPCKHGYLPADDPHTETVCQWVSGNVSSWYPPCLDCRKPVSSSLSLSGYRCVWCKDTVHDKCMQGTHRVRVCPLGPYRGAIVPPSWVRRLDLSGGEHQYILRPPAKLDLDHQPVAVFINRRSGGQAGRKVYRAMCGFLNPVQVFDLGEGGPERGLNLFLKNLPRCRVLACGGDGTAGWLLSALDKTETPGVPRPALGVIPLGTGNDLARTLGWGSGYNGESVRTLLDQLQRSEVRMMDRWKISIGPSRDDLKHVFTMNNYFSLGIDAKIALSFHLARERHQQWFKNRTANKIIYAGLGAKEMFDGCENMNKVVSLYIDDQPCKRFETSSVQGIVVLNLPSYAGGSDLWNLKGTKSLEPRASADPATSPTPSETQQPEWLERPPDYQPGRRQSISIPEGELHTWQKQEIDDGVVEVVGLKSSLHVGQIKVSLSSAVRLGQGKVVRLEIQTDRQLPAQVDGEPWSQEAAVIEIRHHNTVPMLAVQSKSAKS